MKETIYSEIKLCTMQYKNQDHTKRDNTVPTKYNRDSPRTMGGAPIGAGGDMTPPLLEAKEDRGT